MFERYDSELHKWIETDIKNLKKGDLIRIFDDGARYVNKGNGQSTWTIASEYFVNKQGYIMVEVE